MLHFKKRKTKNENDYQEKPKWSSNKALNSKLQIWSYALKNSSRYHLLGTNNIFRYLQIDTIMFAFCIIAKRLHTNGEDIPFTCIPTT